MEPDVDPLSALVALSEPQRRRVYEYVASSAGEVNRDDVASALGVARSVAAFHLDKLVKAGLLEVRYRRPPGRGGPGAGRPAKWYWRAAGEINVSVPERRYHLAAELLARATERAVEDGSGIESLLADVAREYGRGLAHGLRGISSDPSLEGEKPALREQIVDLLTKSGYEPRLSLDTVTLANCPFDALASRHRELVCHMNHALISGIAEAAGLPPEAARLEPRSGRCCVVLSL